jgi:dipeptidyl aminopeptidase/acylaminoacyl peptidase
MVRILSLSAMVSAGFAAPKLDFDRETPVPATETIPVMDFFRPRSLQQPELNPSGTHIAAVVTVGDDLHQLLVYDRMTKKSEQIGGSYETDIYQVRWLNDRRLVFNLSSLKLYALGLLAADVGSLTDASPLLQYYGSQLIAVPPQNRLRPLVWNRSNALESPYRDIGVATINAEIMTGKLANLGSTANGASSLEVRNNNQKHIVDEYPVPEPGLTYHYMADRDGKLAFAFTSDDGKLAMHQLVNRQWVKCPVDLEHIDVVGRGDQPGQVVVVGPEQVGKPRALQLMDAATGQLGEVLLQDQAYDFDGWLYYSPGTHDIQGAVFQRNGPRVVWFTEEYRNLQKVLDGFFPGLVVRIIGSDEAEKIFLVYTSSDRQPLSYFWVDLQQHKVGLIRHSAPWIDPKRMQPMNPIKFKTRDGRQLDAYLTLPAGATKKNPPPLVVLPHGGPWVRDSWGFDGEVQFLASRGYAVLQPNYRGSPGYGWMFPKEDEWDFRKMHDDVTDATKTLIASGLIDGGRVAIMGGSFGGYLAISGVVNEPSLYRCAVTIAGVFDWANQIKDKKFNQYDNPAFGRLMKKLGNPAEQREKFDAISPGRHVDQIRVPVFVAAGKEDRTVDIEQARSLISALGKYNVPHEKLIISDEAHGMAHLDNQVELYTRIEAFLAKNLMPAKPAAPPPAP